MGVMNPGNAPKTGNSRVLNALDEVTAVVNGGLLGWVAVSVISVMRLLY